MKKSNEIMNFFRFSILAILMPGCFTDQESIVTYEEAFLRMVTPEEAGMVREYFETRGLSNNLSPKIKVVTTYRRRFETDESLRLFVSAREQKFGLSYELTAFILKPDSDKSLLAKLKEFFPFFAQNRLATLCSYQNFLTADNKTLESLYMYGVPVGNPERLRGFSSVLLTSDLYWIHKPEEPENHLKKCQKVFKEQVQSMAISALTDIQVNTSFPGAEQACRPPDPRERLRNKNLLHQGDSDCMTWYHNLTIPAKDLALPRCIQESASGNLGICELRARSAKSIVLFRQDGILTPQTNSHGFTVVTNPTSSKFFCDETVGASLIINQKGSWFNYYSASCYNPGW